MLKRTVYGTLLTLLLFGMSTLALNTLRVKAEDNLVLEMNANKNIVTIGEKINITLTLKNVGETNVTITYGPPLFDVYYCTPEGCFRWSDGMLFIQMVLNLTLEPGETYSDTLQWNLYQYVNREYRPPKPGTYHLFGICCPTGTVTLRSIAVTLIEPPVGGYTFPIKGYKTATPLTLYLTLMGILLVSFTIVKRKMPRKTRLT